MGKLAEAFGNMIFGFVIAIGFSIYNAWLFKDLWNWFIASNFNLPQIGTAMAMGILTVMAWPVVGGIVAVIRTVGYKQAEGNAVLSSLGWQLMISFIHTMSWLIGYILVRNFI